MFFGTVLGRGGLESHVWEPGRSEVRFCTPQRNNKDVWEGGLEDMSEKLCEQVSKERFLEH